jgi:hypothetical protein
MRTGHTISKPATPSCKPSPCARRSSRDRRHGGNSPQRIQRTRGTAGCRCQRRRATTMPRYGRSSGAGRRLVEWRRCDRLTGRMIGVSLVNARCVRERIYYAASTNSRGTLSAEVVPAPPAGAPPTAGVRGLVRALEEVAGGAPWRGPRAGGVGDSAASKITSAHTVRLRKPDQSSAEPHLTSLRSAAVVAASHLSQAYMRSSSWTSLSPLNRLGRVYDL